MELPLFTRQQIVKLLLSKKKSEDYLYHETLTGWLSHFKFSNSVIETNTLFSLLPSDAHPFIPVLKKITTLEKEKGLSINDIVTLGNQIEYTNFSLSAVQNWTKRDLKAIIGKPKKGKKYSIEQVAIIFIAEDLKNNLDFQTIANLFADFFSYDFKKGSYLIDPVYFYASYIDIWQKAFTSKEINLKILREITSQSDYFLDLTSDPSLYPYTEEIADLIGISILSFQTSYIQGFVRSFAEASLRQKEKIHQRIIDLEELTNIANNSE